jgi:hypothetical protein
MVRSLLTATGPFPHLFFFPFADDIIYDHKFAPEDCLGLDHVDKSGKARAGAGEKAIVIRG